MVEVVAVLIWDNDKFMICLRSANKARSLLREFVGCKVDPNETKEHVLIRECQEELDIILGVVKMCLEIVHKYSNINVHLIMLLTAKVNLSF